MALGNAASAQPKPLYECSFENVAVNRVPDDFLIINGLFVVKEEDGQKFLELPGTPADDFAVQFGPTETAGLRVSARVYGTSTGRRAPVLALGLNGVGGYELQLAPAKKALELFKGEERVASAPCSIWESGTWSVLCLQVRKVKAGEWRVEGKAWKHGTPERAGWTISYEEKSEPPSGRPFLSGHPISGTPIRFDDLVVSRADMQ